MDCRAVVAAATGSAVGAPLDQAVYTSIRSPTARGYRLVATSPGLTADEKRELVQRAPSHGNLTRDADPAGALAGFVLRSGRYALLCARHAGPEPSGRGGLRVHTHALLLTTSVYGRFHYDPFRVEAFVQPHLASAVRKLESPVLPIIAAPETPGEKATPIESPAWPGRSAATTIKILARVLAGEPTVVTDAPSPRAVLRAVWAAAPLPFRRTLSFALGMKPSTQRGFQLLFHASSDGELQTLMRDAALVRLTWDAPPAGVTGPYQPWLEFVRHHLEHGNEQLVGALTEELDGEYTPELLARAAQLATDGASVATLDIEALERLQTKWDSVTPTAHVERELLGKLRLLIAERLAALHVAQTAAAGAPHCPPPD